VKRSLESALAVLAVALEIIDRHQHAGHRRIATAAASHIEGSGSVNSSTYGARGSATHAFAEATDRNAGEGDGIRLIEDGESESEEAAFRSKLVLGDLAVVLLSIGKLTSMHLPVC